MGCGRFRNPHLGTLGMCPPATAGSCTRRPKFFLLLLIFLNFTWKPRRVRGSGIHAGIPSGNVGSRQNLARVTHPKKLQHSRSQPDPTLEMGPEPLGDSKMGEWGPQGTPTPLRGTGHVSPAFLVTREGAGSD